ncbi:MULTISPECIES: S8 family serine peptidase [Pseudoalteromonas]|uniref:S8 family serine peptidase n=1 Tax=Pseudoalteromonas TaxID=53246 RepID=UPI0004459C0B|nr:MULTISPECIES: S8 family serine peptidase [Pseudoalteromonas]EWH07673.1 protease [Pseudoalteromonas lipolytica SCSIO 04301]|tara:strand:+ start:17060 stop:18349 length:1290 start_codon:yes stop_codon:yes gene_type:complete
MKIKDVALGTLLLMSSNLYAAVIKPISPIIEQIDPAIERIEDRLDIPRRALPSIDSIQQLATDISALPSRLAILNTVGKPAFIEIETEQGFRAVERQWILLANEQHRAKLEHIGAQIVSRQSYDALGMVLLRFVVPEQFDSKAQLQRLLSIDDAALLGRNHIYQAQQGPLQGVNTHKNRPVCDLPVRVGMIDSALNLAHPGFVGSTIETRSFLPNSVASPDLHGTAVAGVMIGKTAKLSPLLNQATLYSAAVFYRQSDLSQGATLAAIVDALNWLVAAQVPVINLSFTGPDNAILAAAIKATIAQQVTLVAAAGNDGPAALPLYPAAYENVIAVSAVDKNGQIYRWSNKGDYIDFAALGVNVLTLNSGGGVGVESGTSMAAPQVTAAAACLAANPDYTPHSIYNKLVERAVDKGKPGKDSVFGHGSITY